MAKISPVILEALQTLASSSAGIKAKQEALAALIFEETGTQIREHDQALFKSLIEALIQQLPHPYLVGLTDAEYQAQIEAILTAPDSLYAVSPETMLLKEMAELMANTLHLETKAEAILNQGKALTEMAQAQDVSTKAETIESLTTQFKAERAATQREIETHLTRSHELTARLSHRFGPFHLEPHFNRLNRLTILLKRMDEYTNSVPFLNICAAAQIQARINLNHLANA